MLYRSSKRQASPSKRRLSGVGEVAERESKQPPVMRTMSSSGALLWLFVVMYTLDRVLA